MEWSMDISIHLKENTEALSPDDQRTKLKRIFDTYFRDQEYELLDKSEIDDLEDEFDIYQKVVDPHTGRLRVFSSFCSIRFNGMSSRVEVKPDGEPTETALEFSNSDGAVKYHFLGHSAECANLSHLVQISQKEELRDVAIVFYAYDSFMGHESEFLEGSVYRGTLKFDAKHNCYRDKEECTGGKCDTFPHAPRARDHKRNYGTPCKLNLERGLESVKEYLKQSERQFWDIYTSSSSEEVPCQKVMIFWERSALSDSFVFVIEKIFVKLHNMERKRDDRLYNLYGHIKNDEERAAAYKRNSPSFYTWGEVNGKAIPFDRVKSVNALRPYLVESGKLFICAEAPSQEEIETAERVLLCEDEEELSQKTWELIRSIIENKEEMQFLL